MYSKATLELLVRVPLSEALPFYNYGTAGFRFQADVMDGLMVRVGVLSAVLLLLDQDDAPEVTTGVMITASHNDESYNGVKLANPDGSMLTPSQEVFLTKWVNERDAGEWEAFLEERIQKVAAKTKKRKANQPIPTVFNLMVGRDTRSHSPRLSGLLIEGANAFLEACGSTTATVTDCGILTTPMLHHGVLHSNSQHLPSYIDAKPSRKGYIETYARAYVDLLKGLDASESPSPLRIDGACGVGFGGAVELWAEIQRLCKAESVVATPLTVHNGDGEGPLNDSCGSEHVQKQLEPPTWYALKPDAPSSFPYCCSLDGDADRIVFFGQSSSQKLTQLLDGDQIAILIAHVLKQKFGGVESASSIKMGIVQTAYANGASTNYVKDTLELPVITAKTGVKHLHHAAVEHFDVGIYFEANGHGTVVFSKVYETFAQDCLQGGNPFFVQLHRLINPAVGDALSDMLLVDYLLRTLGWTLEDWSTKLYEDLPSRMLKVKVADRSVITCNSNESCCLQPASVQPLLQTAMQEVTKGRTFIRPSGTEDVVRVYAEAASREEADSLANAAARIVYDICAGVGDRPE